jgi:hypothetical protein
MELSLIDKSIERVESNMMPHPCARAIKAAAILAKKTRGKLKVVDNGTL